MYICIYILTHTYMYKCKLQKKTVNKAIIIFHWNKACRSEAPR